MDSMSGVWYSHYGGRKLDGYRIGKWADRRALLPPGKLALFPGLDIDAPKFRTAASAASVGTAVKDTDYFVFYDDTVYESGVGDGGNGGWGDLVTRYIGIVRAVNTFDGGTGAGAIIIEYLDGGYPRWSADVQNTPLPFFGIYYRVKSAVCVQMANAVDLAALASGRKYHTETATLAEAIARNSAENDEEFISWGVVIPQDKEQ
jgi:hypothetical protein